jgi:hypothetical protein
MTKSNRLTVARPEAMLTVSRFYCACAVIAAVLFEVAGIVNRWMGRFARSLHETRQRQAVQIINRYHLDSMHTDSRMLKDARDRAERT